MNREDIIRMARETGCWETDTGELVTDEIQLGRFAALVASAEREACVNLLMGLHNAQSNNGNHNYYHFAANAIKELRVKL